ncbi:unnamed protein product [Ectocarpus sp. 6 AP-2014]
MKTDGISPENTPILQKQKRTSEEAWDMAHIVQKGSRSLRGPIPVLNRLTAVSTQGNTAQPPIHL